MAQATHKLSARYGGLTGTVISGGEKFTQFQPDDGRAAITVETDEVKPLAKPAKPAKASK